MKRLLVLLLLLPGCFATRLRGYDTIARPGKEIVLTAKLEMRGPIGLSPDIAGEFVTFHLPDGETVTAVSDNDGRAVVVSRPPDGAFEPR